MKRRENESFEDFKKRRASLQLVTKYYLKGRRWNPQGPKKRIFPAKDLMV